MELKKLMNGNRKISFIIILLFLSIKILGQEYRVMYNYTFVSDSTNFHHSENEIMILDIDKNGSVFYSYPKYKFDSLVIEKSKRRENILEGDNSKISYYLEKKYPDYTMTYHTKLGRTNYAVGDTPNINWKLETEISDIKGIKVQKATTYFGGRKWIAWYAKEIPIVDGPYKFSGLPGLIIEVKDLEQQHQFQFIGIEKNSTGFSDFHKNKELLKEKKMTNKEFNKEWKEFKKDPAKDLKFTLLNSKHGFKINYDGKDYSVSDMIRNAEEQERLKIERNNNFLEISLYK